VQSRSSWRGAILRRLLNRELTNGPADSLSRLEHAAEQTYRDDRAPQRPVAETS
jgi:hypothetical protein